MGKILFKDKISVQKVEGDAKNWLTSENVNEIKREINANYDLLIVNKNNIAANLEKINLMWEGSKIQSKLDLLKTELENKIPIIPNYLQNLNTDVNKRPIWTWYKVENNVPKAIGGSIEWTENYVNFKSYAIKTDKITFEDNELVTKKYVDDKLSGGGTGISLANYYNKQEVDNKINKRPEKTQLKTWLEEIKSNFETSNVKKLISSESVTWYKTGTGKYDTIRKDFLASKMDRKIDIEVNYEGTTYKETVNINSSGAGGVTLFDNTYGGPQGGTYNFLKFHIWNWKYFLERVYYDEDAGGTTARITSPPTPSNIKITVFEEFSGAYLASELIIKLGGN